MAEARSKKISILIFLFAVFIMLAFFTASWIYRMYTEQTAFSEKKTLATVECGRYYFSILPESILYENGTLYFEVENTMGAEVETFVVQSVNDQKEVYVALGQGSVQPVSLAIDVTEWALVYPKGCEGVNFRNISFQPSIE